MTLLTYKSFGELSVTPSADLSDVSGISELNNVAVLGEAASTIDRTRFEYLVSDERRGLALQSIELFKSFQGFLARLFERDTEIYFLAWSFDLSGNSVEQYPGSSGGAHTISMKAGSLREFIGSGALLFAPRSVSAGIVTRIQLWESVQGTRDLGKTLQAVAEAIDTSKLSSLLALASGAIGTGVGELALFVQAATELASVVGSILEANGDDHVDFFEGFFPCAEPWGPGPLHYGGNHSAITLNPLTG